MKSERKKLVVPTWLEFAWASFLFGAIDGDKVYQQIISNSRLLELLRNCPQDLSTNKIRDLVIKGFLNRWKCRLPNTILTASEIRNALQDLQPQLQTISGFTLRDPLSTIVNKNTQSNLTLEIIIKDCYSKLRGCSRNFAATATSKLLHVIQPSLFLMWDKAILDHYQKQDARIKDTSEGYALFHEHMRKLILAVDKAFSSAHLVPKPANGQSVEDYLSTQMRYVPSKSIAKFVDEYNWVVITNKVKVPPIWHP